MSKEEELAHCLEKELGYYRAILELTEEEWGKHRRHRPMAEIVSLVKRRHILVGCVEELGETLRPLKQYWMTHRNPAHPLAPRIHRTLAELDRTVGHILELDEKNQAHLQAYLKAVGN